MNKILIEYTADNKLQGNIQKWNSFASQSSISCCLKLSTEAKQTNIPREYIEFNRLSYVRSCLYDSPLMRANVILSR